MQGPADSVTANTISRNINSMRSRLSTLQQEISTNRKANFAVENPRDARTALSLQNEVEAAKSEIKTTDTALTRADAVNEALGSVSGTLKNAREAALGAPNGDTTSGLGNAAVEAHSALNQVVDTLNLEVSGQRLLGGTRTDAAPLSQSVGDLKNPGNGTLIGAVEQRIADMTTKYSQWLGPSSSANIADTVEGGSDKGYIETEGDARRVMAKAAAVGNADAGTLTSKDKQVTLNGSVVGEVHIETVAPEAGFKSDANVADRVDRVTVSLNRDFQAEDGTLKFNLNGEKTVNLNGSETPDGVAASIQSEISGDTNNSGTMTGGVDALFRKPPEGTDWMNSVGGLTNSGADFSSLIYQGNNEDLTARVKGSETPYSAKANSAAVRDALEGLAVEAVVDRPNVNNPGPSGSRPDSILRQELHDAKNSDVLKDPAKAPENRGVNALRDQAIGRMTAGVDNLAREQARIGVAQRELETARESLQARKDVAEKQVTDLQTVDRAAAITELKNVQANLQASYQVTSRVQQLSLARAL